MTPMTRCLAGVALILCLTGAVAAQDKPAVAPRQAVEPAQAGQTARAPEPGEGPQAKCIAQKEGYTHKGKAIGYAIQLTNLCEQRMKCQVYAHLSNARGESRGHGTLVLAPKSKGAAATKTFEMKTSMDSGTAQLSRECKAF
jgi:hypothetical protein